MQSGPHHASRVGTALPPDPVREAVITMVVGGSVLGLALVASGATVLSTLVVERRWLPVTVGEHAEALLSLPWHLADPAASYPPELAAQIAGPVAWWVAAAALVMLVAALAYRLNGAVSGRRRGGWARRGDVKHLRRGGGRVVLGTHRGKAVAVESGHSVLVVGATQTHKTTGLAIPAILEADDMAVIAISVKDDLVSDTIGWRSRLPGTHWVYDPTNVLGGCGAGGDDGLRGDQRRQARLRRRIVTAGWSPLASADTWEGALAMAHDLGQAGAHAKQGPGENRFFFDSAESLLATYLYAAANTDGASMRTVVRWIARHEGDEVEDILARLPSEEARVFFDAVWRDDPKTQSNIFSTARLLVAAFLDPTVAASSERGEITPAAFLDGGVNSLFVVAPPANQDRLRVVFSALVKQFVDAAYAWVLTNGRPLDRRVLIVIDELANIAPIPNLAGLASTAASQGIQLVSIVQDVSQLRSRYGPDDAGTIVNNHRAMLLLTGVKDVATLELASNLLGYTERRHTSVSRDIWGINRGTTESSREHRLAPLDELRQQESGHGTLIYGALRGVQMQLRPWFRDRQLARRARTVPPGSGPINRL